MMEDRQTSPPRRLQSLQERFGESIRTPFSFTTGKFACQKDQYPDEAASSVRPRGSQDGRDRLAVYNEQYWYRLLTVLQDGFPLLAAGLGLWEFNRLATEYLDCYPSRKPYLDFLPDGFPGFIRAHPRHGHPRMVQITDLDAAFLKAFSAPGVEPLQPQLLDSDQLVALGESPLSFQPYFSLVEEDWNLMESRTRLAGKSGERPAFIEMKGYWVIYRRDAIVEWQALDAVQFGLLRELQTGYPLGEACERAASSLEPDGKERLYAGISGWFSEWTRRQCFQSPFFKTPGTSKG